MVKDRIFLAGHNGMVGRALSKILKKQENVELITLSREELDLTKQSQVEDFFNQFKPSKVIFAAARVGGIHANNTFPAEFIYENLQMQNNVIHSAHKNDVQRLLFLGSSCIYPKLSDQPITESALLTGALEPTNEPYAIAKIAGIKMCESYNKQYGRDYRSVMPTNLFGPGDNYHPENSHVIPGLIRRIHEAKINRLSEVLIWGSGKPKREFMYVEDMVDASLYIFNLNEELLNEALGQGVSHINVGTGIDLTISEIAQKICEIIGYEGRLVYDQSKPDGTPRKLLDISKLEKIGWKPATSLMDGLAITYEDYLSRNTGN